MAFTKTRIWRGGVAGSVVPDEDDAPSAAARADAAGAASASPAAAVEADWERAARQHSAKAPRFDADEHTPPFAITRLWPIEQLFPEEHGAAPAEEQPAPAWSAPSPAEGTLRLWWRNLRARSAATDALPMQRSFIPRIAVAALCALGLVAAWQVVPRVREPLRPAHGSPPALPEPPAAVRTTTMPSERTAAPPELPSQTDARGSLPPGLERSAIDALVAGDVARAQQLYRRLVQIAPHQPALREALRVIASQTPAR